MRKKNIYVYIGYSSLFYCKVFGGCFISQKKEKKNIVESGVKHHKHHTPILQKQTGEIIIRINI